MLELVQITAAYSNAVLMVVLSNVTDVATKLDLPITRPVHSSHVWRFVCDPRKDSIGGWLTLTNGYEFWYEHGHVNAMDSDRCYFHLQTPDEIPRFFGTIRMSEAEVVELALQSVRKLGYNPAWLKSESPTVEWARTAPRDKPNIVPHCRVKWQQIEPDGSITTADIEINTDAKRVEMFSLLGRLFRGKPPAIPQPPVMPRPPPMSPTGARRTTALADAQHQIAIKEICGQITLMARELGLPLELPVKHEHLKEAALSSLQGDLRGQFILADGFRFHYRHGHVSAFYAPDSESNVGFNEVLTNLPPVDTGKLYGKVRFTKQQVAEFATREVRKLGYPAPKLFLNQKPLVTGGPHERNPDYARFYVTWKAPGTKSIEEPNAQFTRVEIDGVTLELKSLWLRSTNLYRPSSIKPEKAKE